MPGKTLYCLGEAWLELNSTAPLASAKTFSPRMGGSAASLALAYAAQGGRASLLTQLGEDAFGHRIADALSTAGVDISRVCFTSRAPTPLLFDGGGEQLGCRTLSSELLYAPEQLGADWAADAEMLAFSSACLVDSPCRYTHLAALDTARTAGVPVCFVPSLRPALWPSEKTLPDTVMQFLPFADILLLTADEMDLLLEHPGSIRSDCLPCCGGIHSWWCLRQKRASTPLPGQRTPSGPGFPPRRRAGRTAAVSNLSAGADPEKAHEMQCSGTSDTSITPGKAPAFAGRGFPFILSSGGE